MKKGIGFFPMSCTPSTAEEVLEADFGAPATALLLTLYRKIYGEHGFYGEFPRPVQRVLAHRLSIELSLFDQIIQTAIDVGLFDREMYEQYDILTSVEIQEHFFYAVARRKKFDFERKYLLLSDEKLPKFLQLHPNTAADAASDTTQENVDNTQTDVCKNDDPVDNVQTDACTNDENADNSSAQPNSSPHHVSKTEQTKRYNTTRHDKKRHDSTQNDTIQFDTIQDRHKRKEAKQEQFTQEQLPTHPLEPREDDDGYFGSFANVHLHFGEYKTLVQRYGEYAVDRYIERLSTYMGTKDRDYPNHANTLLEWMEQDKVKVIGR